jgi:hypothetical protein
VTLDADAEKKKLPRWRRYLRLLSKK